MIDCKKCETCELSGDLQDATGMGYVPHWSTCPKWKDFKKK